MSNAVIHIDGPFTPKTAKIAGRRSGEVRRAMRRMTESEVFSLIGDLRTLEDARRQLAALNILGLTGRITGTAQQGAVKAIELFVACRDLPSLVAGVYH